MRSVLQKSLYIFICLSLMIVLVGVTPAYAASISVGTTADDDNFAPSCSLREAITAANNDAAYGGCPAGSGTDTITLPAGTYTLDSELPAVTSTIIINGNSAANTIIQANANPNTSGYRILTVNSGGNLTLNSLTARNGYTPSNDGGGVFNSGTLTITNSFISNNSSPSNSGGGVFNDFSATMTTTNSTFAGNSSNLGGGVYNGNTLTVTNSTFAANSAGATGGGIFNFSVLTIKNSTFSGNSAAAFSGGGIRNVGDLSFSNTIIANSTGGDCLNSNTVSTSTNNLVEDGSCSPALSGDPNLGPLADNGGPTQTMALLYPSTALNAGNDATCAAAPVNNTSQNGVTRPQGTHCDIGAYEVDLTPTQSGPAFVVNSNADTSDGVCDLRGQGFGNQDCTLREAIDTSNTQAGANTITFDSAYVNAANPITTNGVSALSSITTQITITGNSATDTIIQAGISAGSANRRIFLVTSTGNLTLNKLTLKNGHCYLSCVGFPGGGAILSQGILTINDSIFSDNHANNYEGGSILNIGTLTVNNSTFLGNPAFPSDSGGAISNGSSFSGLHGTATISNSTFSGNYTGNSGAAIANVTAGSTLTLVNSSIFDNHSTGNRAGAIFVRGTVNIYNSTISGNVANINGDNIYQDVGTLNLYNTIIANSTSHGDCVMNSGTVNSTNSLIESTAANACGLTNGSNGNIVGSDPSLRLSTGSPAYLPLNTSSPAIDTGNNSICAAAPVNNQSQNGITRPVGATCDIGSVEANPIPLPTGWVGSVSVTSNKNVVTVGRPHIGSEIASYDGFSSGSLTSFVPMLFKDAFGGSYDAALYIQNVSGSSANITINFYDSTGTLSCTKNDTVSPLASKGYWLPSESCLPAGWVGGVKVTSNQNIVAVGRPHIGSEVMTYNGFSSGSTSAFIPMLFKGAFGGSYNAAFYIQNVSGSSANLTLEYFDSTGTLNCTKSDTLAPLASIGYWLPSATCDSGSLPAGWVGGVRVTSNQNIVSVGRPHIGSQITTYDGFSTGTGVSYIPMLFKDAFGGSYDSAFYIQNVHTTNTANVTIKYYDNAGTLNCTKTDTLAPLASVGYWVPSATCDSGSLPVGWVGGVEVTSDQPIVAVGRPHIGTQVTTYNGFTSGAASAFLPMLFKDAFGGSYDAAFYLQNTEASAASVTIQFYDSSGVLTCSRTDTIQPRATLGFWAPSVTCMP